METEANFFVVDSIIYKNYEKTVEAVEKTIKECFSFREEHNRIIAEYIAFLERDVIATMTSIPKTKTEDKELVNLDWRKYGF